MRTFAAEGAHVAFTYTRDEPAATPARSFKVSVLDAAATEAMTDELERDWKGIDILVNNAGLSQNLPLALMEEEDWDKVLDTNVKGMFITSRAVVRGMIRQRSGSILNIGSLAGERMLDAPIHYCASKSAVRGLTESLAKELARYSIRVNCLAPGLLEDGVGPFGLDFLEDRRFPQITVLRNFLGLPERALDVAFGHQIARGISGIGREQLYER